MEDVHDIGDHQEARSSFSLEFDWVLIQPGGGHIEMNMLKGITDVCWDIFWKDLAILMNFRSEKALQCCRRVTDHHKGWQMLRIARESLAKELALPFVREQLLEEKPNLTAVAFCKFMQVAVKDPVYALLADLCFEFIDSIATFRKGIRESQFDLVFSGLGKFAKLWSGRDHRNYRELEMSFNLTWIRMPEDLKTLVKKSWSLNTSGIKGTNESPDFKLEAINKTLQHWLPSSPTGIDWLQVCCQFDELAQLRDELFSQMNITDPKTKKHHGESDMSVEILHFRRLLREKKYLLQPRIGRNLVSLSGEELDEELLHFSQKCRMKRSEYFDAYVKHEEQRTIIRTSVPFKVAPIFVTKQERQKYEKLTNKTKETLINKIEEKLAAITEDQVREAFRDAWNCEVLQRKGTKNDYIAFCEELLEYFEDTTDYLEGMDYDSSP